MLWQPPLGPQYAGMTEGQLAEAIAARREELGDQLVILGHHYQQDDVVRHADFTGDSFKLAQLASEKVNEVGARYVIFCGVHFMAESADVLTPEDVAVILPDLSAGCSMADMADYDDTVEAWRQIHEVWDGAGSDVRVVPITYMNSSAAIKAFVGEHGGAVCTSSNAEAVMAWAFAGGTAPKREGESIRILFLPDQHLGRNTAAAMGYDIHRQMCLWDPQTSEPLGGNDAATIEGSDVILWKGHCSVHKLFRPEHVDQIKVQQADMTVIVHPECEYEVVQRADISASTEGIIKAIDAGAPGSAWAVGTEVHLGNRLASRHPDKHVRILSDCQCLCTTMYRVDPSHLLWTLDELAAGRVVNRITVPPGVRRWSLVALRRMLALTGGQGGARQAEPAIAR
ncbi:MAG: quinolinate synthase [Planctomycetaceae bacterium]|nr:quinolinate synthase [Planctomycetaceae bacterium]